MELDCHHDQLLLQLNEVLLKGLLLLDQLQLQRCSIWCLLSELPSVFVAAPKGPAEVTAAVQLGWT